MKEVYDLWLTLERALLGSQLSSTPKKGEEMSKLVVSAFVCERPGKF